MAALHSFGQAHSVAVWHLPLPARQATPVHRGAVSYIVWLFQGAVCQFGGAYSRPGFTTTRTNPEKIRAGASPAIPRRQSGQSSALSRRRCSISSQAVEG
ncbi:MAG: hypothetical protein AVDCRST_MAG26-28 [uncultured Chloroflexia bacterium]|uniref:Uncharacterized protein n=1 Tax=uncultured Chloroflexia bacterium TaxID=1672391 RepID=A0A6J4GYL6_9CHLR|nr:MAG: hypothetical protein AVDCRST_MAG26-28 [uncultured Chloroflexia bacterium]